MAYSQTRRMIDQRRKKESEYRDMDAVIADNKKQFQIANFEITTCIKIDRKKEIDEAYKSKLKNDAKLLSRRQTLAALYNDEMESWKMEALSKVESQEDRKKRLEIVIIDSMKCGSHASFINILLYHIILLLDPSSLSYLSGACCIN